MEVAAVELEWKLEVCKTILGQNDERLGVGGGWQGGATNHSDATRLIAQQEKIRVRVTSFEQDGGTRHLIDK